VITLYTKDHCQPCRATKRKLTDLGVEFVEVNVEHDPEARQRLIDAGFMESPVVWPEAGDPWSGFRPDLLATLTPKE
jgi:glutaredoxin-like protein NrdH